jgi:hypothetical protein
MIGGISATNHHCEPFAEARMAAMSDIAATIGIRTNITSTFVTGV